MRRCGLAMNKLYIMKKALWVEPSPNDPDALAALKAEFPGRSARRMTRLGMQMSHVLRGMSLSEESSLVYATRFSETQTIEKFLGSFPFPSPQAFQTSIHPGGVEQFLIQNKQSIREFFPLAGGTDLLFRALQTAMLCRGSRIIICGGEETGTWLQEAGASSESNYAWALELTGAAKASENVLGRLTWIELAGAEGASELLPDFFTALQNSKPYRYRSAEGSELELNWSE